MVVDPSVFHCMWVCGCGCFPINRQAKLAAQVSLKGEAVGSAAVLPSPGTHTHTLARTHVLTYHILTYSHTHTPVPGLFSFFRPPASPGGEGGGDDTGAGHGATPGSVDLSPIESVFRKHMSKALGDYSSYLNELDSRFERRKQEIAGGFAKASIRGI